MGYMKEQKYILAVAVCAGIIVTVPEILQAESITVENRSETRTSVEKNGTLADRVQRAQSSVSIAGETQNRDEAEKAFESLQRHEDAMRMKPMYSDERLER